VRIWLQNALAAVGFPARWSAVDAVVSRPVRLSAVGVDSASKSSAALPHKESRSRSATEMVASILAPVLTVRLVGAIVHPRELSRSPGLSRCARSDRACVPVPLHTSCDSASRRRSLQAGGLADGKGARLSVSRLLRP
jgi:hypothetical protein